MEAVTSPRFQRDETGITALDAMPDVLEFARELIDSPNLTGMVIRDNMIDIICTNGRWVYEIIADNPERPTVVGRIRYREEHQ